SRRRHTRFSRDWSSDVCSSDLIDVKPIRDYDQFVGKNMEFKVVKINQEFKNVVVSHKALIEAELEAQKKQIIGGLEKGQVLEGRSEERRGGKKCRTRGGAEEET